MGNIGEVRVRSERFGPTVGEIFRKGEIWTVSGRDNGSDFETFGDSQAFREIQSNGRESWGYSDAVGHSDPEQMNRLIWRDFEWRDRI